MGAWQLPPAGVVPGRRESHDLLLMPARSLACVTQPCAALDAQALQPDLPRRQAFATHGRDARPRATDLTDPVRYNGTCRFALHFSSNLRKNT